MSKKLGFTKVCCVIAGLGALGAAAPVLAQTNDQEIKVIGKYGKVPDNVQSLTEAVSYADLNLSTDAGKDELRHRIRLTARYLCNKLGEPESVSYGPVPSCREAAVKDAMDRVNTAEEHYAPHGTTWVAGPAWQPPYPADWDDQGAAQ